MISSGPPVRLSELNMFPSSVRREKDGRFLILSAASADFSNLTMIPPSRRRKIMPMEAKSSFDTFFFMMKYQL
jgi:hypothetical protein